MADFTHITTASASHPFIDLGAFVHDDGTFFRFSLRSLSQLNTQWGNRCMVTKKDSERCTRARAHTLRYLDAH